MPIIVDASFGHAQITPKALKRIAASGAILYAGCNDARKCCTKAELHALLDAGYEVGLVIENNTQDMRDGHAVGVTYGRNIATAAKRLGYDLERAVLYTAADWDVTGLQVDEVDAFMTGFRSEVPVPGIYGDTDALDYVAGKGHALGFWQTNAMSWSHNKTSPHAHLQQRWNDPRAKGLPVDVNDVVRGPLYLMGEIRPPATTPSVPASPSAPSAQTTQPEGADAVATIYRPSGKTYHFPVLVDGASKTVLTDHRSVVALLAQGAKQIVVAPADFDRIRKGAVA